MWQRWPRRRIETFGKTSNYHVLKKLRQIFFKMLESIDQDGVGAKFKKS
jgi:hypothetical protein